MTPHLVGGDRLVVAPFADRVGDPPGGLDAQIGADQDLLDLLQHGPVELALGHEVGDRPGDRGRSARQPALEPLPPGLLGAVVHVGAVIAVRP